ncbi:MAG: class I SAM-dependent methyltransferase [Myxococcales bacterium]|nr:class I SAM-dependent methyltransferase [Myxococcales bacterium]
MDAQDGAPKTANPSPDPTDAATSYAGQARGGTEAYAAYYAGMDKSMQQKVALTTAYFPVRGTLADMGCGSGAGSYDLACLHEGLHVVGVDVAPESVAYAKAHYRRPNLEYRLGDIAEPIFDRESLDGVLNSSVFHHLTSFNDFSLQPVRRALDEQTRALRPGGVLIIRDFVVPRGPAEVLIDLPMRDGAPAEPSGASDVAGLSSAALFERFAAEWRSSQNPTGPVPYRRLGSVRPGWQRYRTSLRAASEFVLRKDYRSDWAAECKEEYTYFSQAEFERELAQRDLRIAVSIELRNPWIVENRFRGRFFLYDLDEKPLPYPPTNYLVVGEKVRRGQGVGFSLQVEAPERSAPAPDGVLVPSSRPRFLRLSRSQHRETGRCMELIERPHPVVDLLPFFHQHGRLFVLGRQGYPRPLVHAAQRSGLGAEPQGTADWPWASPSLDGASVAGYLTEPLTAMVRNDEGLGGEGVGDDGEASPALRQHLHALWHERVGLPERWIAKVRPGLRYFTSPGGLNERVSSLFIELHFSHSDLGPDGLPLLPEHAPNPTKFARAGCVRPLLATQLLRAAQVGGLLDARLELNVYELFSCLIQSDVPTENALTLGTAEPDLARTLGPWIGAEISLRIQAASPALQRTLLGPAAPRPDDIDAVLQPAPRAVFVPFAVQTDVGTEPPAPFLRIERLRIAEHAADGQIVASEILECALPSPTSSNTVSVFPVLRVGDAAGEVFVGIELRDLPAVQAFTGQSRFATNPAWRLPRSIVDLTQAEAWLGLQLRQQFGLRTLRSWPLGGKYYPAVGATPEQVYPLVAEVDAESVATSSLSFVPLTELWRRRQSIEDGHLRIGLWRLCHALGVL